jgi:hypothetical protein
LRDRLTRFERICDRAEFFSHLNQDFRVIVPCTRHFSRSSGYGCFAEPLSVALLDERADRELPSLLRAFKNGYLFLFLFIWEAPT